MAPASNKEVLDIQANYRVQIHSETRRWHENNMQLKNVQLARLKSPLPLEAIRKEQQLF